jgi:hypothetical protein
MDKPANDNEIPITYGSGNVFIDLGFEADEAERAVAALREYRANGGKSFDDFKRELAATVVDLVPKVYQLPIRKGEA